MNVFKGLMFFENDGNSSATRSVPFEPQYGTSADALQRFRNRYVAHDYARRNPVACNDAEFDTPLLQGCG